MKKQIITIALFLFLMIILAGISLVSAFEFDNIKGDLIKNKDASEYGKIEIRNSVLGWEWFQLDKVMSLELKENTKLCSEEGCSADTEIVMYEDGKLIDDIKFVDLKTGKETTIESYEIYVNGDLYNYEEVSGYSKGVKYDIELKGKLHPFQKVDWQIRAAGTDWIDDWAVWTDSLTNGSIAYWKFDESSGTNVEDSMGYYDLTTNSSNWTTGIINNALDFNGTSYTAYNDSFLDKNMTDLSLSFWFKPNDWYNSTKASIEELVGKIDAVASNRIEVMLYGGGGGGELRVFSIGEGGASVQVASDQTHWEAGNWHHAVIVWSVTHGNITLWMDGEFNESEAQTATLNTTTLLWDFAVSMSPRDGRFFNGTIDEVGVWNRTLNMSEITNLYNSGSAISPPYKPVVVLNAPIDNYNTTNGSEVIIFNCTASISGGLNISNISLYHNASGTWTLNQTNSTTRNLNSTSTFDVVFNKHEDIEWNCYACANNSFCVFGTNRTLNIKKLIVVEENYSQVTTEGNVETFYINITTGNFDIDSANLTYDNTNYPATFTQDVYNFSVSRTINIPQITASKNLTFNWSFELDDSSITTTISHNQSVLSLNIDNCTTYTNVLFNISLRDEEDQTILNQTTQNTSIKLEFAVASSNGTEMINYSTFFDVANPATVCLESPLNQSSLRLDGIIEYSSLGRFTEFYHFQNYSLDETTTDINLSLYNLNSSNGQEFKIVYKDSNFIPVEGVILDVQRKYVDEGIYKTTERPKTGTEGYTIAHLTINDVLYNIIVYQEGNILASFNDIVADCQNPTLVSCSINLNSYGSSVLPESFATVNDVSFTLTYDKETREVDTVFTILSGASSSINLEVNLSDSLGSTAVCNDTLYASGGGVNCVVPLSFGNSTVTAKLYKNGDLIGQSIIRIAPDPSDIYGSSIIFIALFAFILIIGIGISDSPMIMGIVLILGVIALTALNIIYTPSLIGVGATILYFIIAVIIILIKGSSRQ